VDWPVRHFIFICNKKPPYAIAVSTDATLIHTVYTIQWVVGPLNRATAAASHVGVAYKRGHTHFRSGLQIAVIADKTPPTSPAITVYVRIGRMLRSDCHAPMHTKQYAIPPAIKCAIESKIDDAIMVPLFCRTLSACTTTSEGARRSWGWGCGLGKASKLNGW
jgi:hypothetical protein